MERQITLRALGDAYAFETFGDGSEVVDRLSYDGPLPDVLLLDWMMPGMSGDEVVRWLRSQPRTQTLPIIMVTASRVETQDVVTGLALGANDYVARPFAPEELRARVDAVARAKALADAHAREQARVTAVNHLGQALFEVGPTVPGILEVTAKSIVGSVCDGCAIILLPGELPPVATAHHRNDPTAQALSAISSLADPIVYAFASDAEAMATLPPAYHAYIRQFGLSALAILPFPTRTEIQGVVTLTRDRHGRAFDADDLATLSTCIEYSSLAVQNAMRLEAERLARGRLHAVLAHAPIGIVVTDAFGHVALANDTASALVPLLDASKDLALALSPALRVVVDKAPATVATWLGQIAAGTTTQRAVIVIPNEHAEVRTLSVAAVVLRDPHYGNTGTVFTFEDVTDAHALAAERERTARFQEQMLGIVGHDLRNPLGAILAGVELVGMQVESNPKILPIVSRVKNSVHRMSTLIGQLYDVTSARLGQGIALSLTETDLSAVATHVVEELRLSHRGATLVLTAPPTTIGTWDADRLAQVVSNLGSNAIQYGRPDSPIVIEIEDTSTGVSLRVKNEVRDAPIEADGIAGLFEPYRRGGDAALHSKGLGLGLYIVHEIVVAHRGDITAASSVEAGTVFEIKLPRSSRR
ncbi:hypothetical protein BH11MYX2_BH11MYX2_07630 [soil metagenome]